LLETSIDVNGPALLEDSTGPLPTPLNAYPKMSKQFIIRVVVDASDTEICSVVQGDIETTHSLSQTII
jgi:hypothetical protein